jgi:hypothetical protein
MKPTLLTWWPGLCLGLVVGHLLLAAPAANPEPPAAPVLPATVRIEHEWVQISGVRAFSNTQYSLGTVIAPGVVVSHAHFRQPGGQFQAEVWRFTTGSGQAAHVAAADLDLLAAGVGTTQIALGVQPRLDATPAEVAERATILGLQPGDRVTIVYWDDASGQAAQGDFIIVATGPGAATLADPEKRINGGDSGGGAFYAGQLVGATWSVLEDQEHRPLGLFRVALLSAPAEPGELQVVQIGLE